MPKDEKVVLEALAEAWNNFLKLPSQHPWDQQEFMHAIHQAQNIVLSRAGMRELYDSNDAIPGDTKVR